MTLFVVVVVVVVVVGYVSRHTFVYHLSPRACDLGCTVSPRHKPTSIIKRTLHRIDLRGKRFVIANTCLIRGWSISHSYALNGERLIGHEVASSLCVCVNVCIDP